MGFLAESSKFKYVTLYNTLSIFSYMYIL